MSPPPPGGVKISAPDPMRRALRNSRYALPSAWSFFSPLVSPLAAQTNTGQISGVVRDVQGGALPGARVIAEHVDSGVRVEYPTDEAGRYHLLSLRVGMYVISVELPGFRRVVRSGVIVQLGQAQNLDFTLDVGGPVEEIRVTASVPLLQTGSAEISDVIENQQVVQLPLNGRNFLSLAQLSDAVVIPPGGTRGDSLQQAGPLPNVGGQRSGHNIYLLDGVKGHRRTVQQPGHQPVGRFDPGIQDPEVAVSGRVRRQGISADQRRHARRHEQPARKPVRVLPTRPVRRAQLLRSEGSAGAAAPPESVRRRARRADRARSQLLLLQLRRAARPALADADVLRADSGGARRRLLRQRHRSAIRSPSHRAVSARRSRTTASRSIDSIRWR